MGCLGNILWLILGGIISGLSWIFVGLLWCVTIIGIPVGVQCFKLAGLSFMPFGRNVEYGGGAVSLIANILWLIFGGLGLALEFCIFGILLSITIIGIPFGIQFFKLARLALFPFGAQVN
ncbi:MAG: YccF domain-containing protein [Ruminococcus sp.]|nr:YccF domain-containing protein [Ruminococcus sp.]